MDRMYRWTRHIYDASRKYYLLGRDRVLRQMSIQPDARVLEIGCGTARNLILLAKRHPQARFFGLDASEQMLDTAARHVTRAHLGDRIRLAQGLAERFDPQRVFTSDSQADPSAAPGTGFDHILFSYCLSMIPPWRESIDHGLELLKPGGHLWIVDFGDLTGLPRPAAALVRRWLTLFHVEHRPQLPHYLADIRQTRRGLDNVDVQWWYRRYTMSAHLVRSTASA
jgi:S-adenosylmethionine-diacylgycerolhomoserine-N-methlytransferase